MGEVHYLNAGIYTVGEAARLVDASEARVRGWITGQPNSDAPPLIENELSKVGHRIALSFTNLIEARFIKLFSDEGVSIRGIRAMAEEAQEFLDHAHPFATNLKFKTDGKEIFVRMTNRLNNEEMLYGLKSRHWQLKDIMKPFLREPIGFGDDGNARIWHPRKQIAKHVVIVPTHAFGQPVLEASGVPTSALVDALRAESGNAKRVAKWYEVPLAQVREACRFEESLAA